MRSGGLVRIRFSRIPRSNGVRFGAILLLTALFFPAAGDCREEPFTVCRLKYDGGGDWYSDPSSLPNLLREVEERLGIEADDEEEVRAPSDSLLRLFPFLYMTGHGNVRFSGADVGNLQRHLRNGGFLWVDDNYGLDESFRREVRKLFPEENLQVLPANHSIFHGYYDFPEGLPAVHEHDPEKGPEALAIFQEGRMVLLYTYQSDIGDGLEDPDVHEDPKPIREAAMRMALNIVWYAASH